MGKVINLQGPAGDSLPSDTTAALAGTGTPSDTNRFVTADGIADLGKTRVTVDDTLAKFLSDKLAAGSGVSLSVTTDENGVQTINVASEGGGQVLTDATDSVLGFLQDKLAAGAGVTLTVIPNGSFGNTLRIDYTPTEAMSPAKAHAKSYLSSAWEDFDGVTTLWLTEGNGPGANTMTAAIARGNYLDLKIGGADNTHDYLIFNQMSVLGTPTTYYEAWYSLDFMSSQMERFGVFVGGVDPTDGPSGERWQFEWGLHDSPLDGGYASGFAIVHVVGGVRTIIWTSADIPVLQSSNLNTNGAAFDNRRLIWAIKSSLTGDIWKAHFRLYDLATGYMFFDYYDFVSANFLPTTIGLVNCSDIMASLDWCGAKVA